MCACGGEHGSSSDGGKQLSFPISVIVVYNAPPPLFRIFVPILAALPLPPVFLLIHCQSEIIVGQQHDANCLLSSSVR